ncbi:helix-turn-helix domain-containing protein [Mariniflexile sp.]|uniref:helix-turn-helix domain-containing protein n=1 Tax=Mariniflexile sp. TaxID=1979402 RepID=UPI00356931B8
MQNTLIKNFTISDIVEIIGDNPQKDSDLHVHISKNKFEVIPFSHPFRGGNYSFLLVIQGELKVQLNLINYTIGENEMIAIKPQTVIQALDMSKHLEVVCISFTVDFILKNAFKKSEFDALDFFTANSIPKLKLSNDDKDTTLTLAKLLAKTNAADAADIPFRDELTYHTFDLLMYHFGSLFTIAYPNLEAELTRQEELTLRFLKILNDNFKNEHSVQFYADILCLTSGHLSKVLKEVSGKTAGQLIDDAIIMEAKILLNNPSLSISQIAYELKFSNQSFFGKYFKKNTGISPSQYRKGN